MTTRDDENTIPTSLEIESLIDKLGSVAEKQGISTLKIDVLILKAKYAFLQGNLDLTNKLLEEAMQISDKKGLYRHYQRIENERMNIDTELMTWSQIIKQGSKIIENLNVSSKKMNTDFETINLDLEKDDVILSLKEFFDINYLKFTDLFDKVTFPSEEIFKSSSRLKILLYLLHTPMVTFSELQLATGLTPSNLSKQSKILGNAGFISIDSQFQDASPVKIYNILTHGRNQLRKYAMILFNYIILYNFDIISANH
jgi:DNA-binding transcriptional ArsR family regulator